MVPTLDSLHMDMHHLDKTQPHVAMLYTRDGTFQSSCDLSKSHAMCGDAFPNMLEILLPVLE